jgi:hypothetical protein
MAQGATLPSGACAGRGELVEGRRKPKGGRRGSEGIAAAARRRRRSRGWRGSCAPPPASPGRCHCPCRTPRTVTTTAQDIAYAGSGVGEGRIVRPLMGVGFGATARDSLEVELERRQAGERGEERSAPVVADAVPSARPATPESAVGCARTDRAIQTLGWGGAGQGVCPIVCSPSRPTSLEMGHFQVSESGRKVGWLVGW